MKCLTVSDIMPLWSTSPPDIFLSTEGDAGDYQGDKLGQYRCEGEVNEKRCYKQLHSVRDGRSGYYLFYNREGHIIISDKLDDDGKVYLMNKTSEGELLKGIWLFRVNSKGTKFQEDNNLTVTFTLPRMPQTITMPPPGSVVPPKISSCMGDYSITDKYKCGHPVYELSGDDVTFFMFVAPGYVGWRISDRCDRNWRKRMMMMSPSCNGLAPDQERNMRNTRNSNKTWMIQKMWIMFTKLPHN